METEIAQAIEQGGEEVEIVYLVSLWSDQMTSEEDSSLGLDIKSVTICQSYCLTWTT